MLAAASRSAVEGGPKVMGIVVSNLTEKAREAAKRHGVRLYTAHHMTCEANADRRFNR